jgi:hypothetical protein
MTATSTRIDGLMRRNACQVLLDQLLNEMRGQFAGQDEHKKVESGG